MSTLDYRQRFYRNHEDTRRWKTFSIKRDASDLYIRASQDLTEPANRALAEVRHELEEYISRERDFLHSLEPVPLLDNMPGTIRSMCEAGLRTGTGPMSAVAGAIAEHVGRALLKESNEVLVENGGDTWLSVREPVTLKVFPGNVFFDRGLAISIKPEESPCSVCTSSGKLGHSISFGKADAVTVIARTGALADAAATATANRVNCIEDIPGALEFADAVEGVTGVLIVHRDRLGAVGSIELCEEKS